MKTGLRELLAARQRKVIDSTLYIPSAVLIPLYWENGECYIVFIKRTDKVKVHKGQISFPGGGIDKRDKTRLDTALREAREEIGLRPEDAEILGQLDDQVAYTSNYVLTPFVARIPWPYKFVPNKAEVAEVFQAPVSAFRDKSCFKAEEHTVAGHTLPGYHYYYQGRVIFGATAGILHQFLEIIDQIAVE